MRLDERPELLRRVFGSGFGSCTCSAVPVPALVEELQDRRVDRLRVWGGADLYRLECDDCGAELAMGLEALAAAGAPRCGCGGCFGSDRLEEIIEAERELAERASAPRRLQDRLLKTRKDHLCSRCHSDIPAGETARYRVEIIEGEPVWVLFFEPKPGKLPEKTRMDKALNRSNGRLYVSQHDHGIMRIEFEMREPIRFLWGFVATLKNAVGRLEFERTEPDVWLPRKFDLEIDLRVFFRNRRQQVVREWIERQPLAETTS